MGPNVTDHVDYSSAIVPTGQEPAQAPHDTQPSLITRAIVATSFVKKIYHFLLICSYSNTNHKNKQDLYEKIFQKFKC